MAPRRKPTPKRSPDVPAARGRTRKPTIKDVAEQAGVSLGTASNVLNRPEVLAPETLARVLEAIEQPRLRPELGGPPDAWRV